MLDSHGKTHKYYDYGHKIDEACGKRKVIYLSRNPLDVAVSMYFQEKYRGKAPQGSIFDYVKKKIHKVIDFQLRIERLKTDHWHFVTYEELKSGPKALYQVFKYIDVNLDMVEAKQIWKDCSFENMKTFHKDPKYKKKKYRLVPGVDKHKDNPDAYKVRKGKVKGYTDYLTPEQIKTIKKAVGEKYGANVLDRM